MSLSLTRQFVVVFAITIFLSTLISSVATFVVINAVLSPQMFILILLSSGLIAGIGSIVSGLYMRHLVQPLWHLVRAARKMGQGDLVTPIHVAPNTVDIQTLADTLEYSRAQLAQTLNDLAQVRDWSQTLIQSITEGIVSFNADHHITFLSDGAARILGWNGSEILGKTINEVFILPDKNPTSFAEQIPPVGGRQPIVILNPQGQPITLAVTRARQTSDGQTTIVLHDITEETIRRNLQTYFLANMSHEFRTPLAGLRVSIELLLEHVHQLSPSEINELLNSIHLSATSLQNLIDNLLESSKIEANQFTLRRRPVRLNDLLAEGFRVILPLLNRRKQAFTVAEPLQMPQVRVDSVRLVQVMVNLLSNASKYSPPDTSIDFMVEAKSDCLCLSVADRGIGIPVEQTDSLFRRFVRLKSSDKDLKPKEDYGTGLGLSVVKAIVEGHGGTVGVKARAGGGSVFWFTLPLEGAAP